MGVPFLDVEDLVLAFEDCLLLVDDDLRALFTTKERCELTIPIFYASFSVDFLAFLLVVKLSKSFCICDVN